MLSTVRRHITGSRVRSALARRGPLPPLDLVNDADGAVGDLVAALRDSDLSDPILWWVRSELAGTGDLDRLLDGLAGPAAATRILCLRLAGALAFEEAGPWVGRLLAHEHSGVQAAAARALGRIAGARSADALVRALYWRRGATRRVVIELARAAPDHYLESALAAPEFADVRGHLVLAVGLRRRRLSIPSLVPVQATGARSERVAVCRALGWIGHSDGVPVLEAALEDQAWQVRAAAIRGLVRIGDRGSAEPIAALAADRYPEVRALARAAVRRLSPGSRLDAWTGLRVAGEVVA